MDPFHTMQTIHDMQADDKLLVVSDGSSHESRSMSFGFAIGTHSGTPLLENMGPAYGKPSSHRAESTGCLSGALALKHLQTFTQIPFPPELQTVVISDNDAMIKSLTDRATYHSVYPNATLAPDWDLLEEIHQQYRTITSLHIKFQWVRGHQDTSTALGGLSSEAKLNVQADRLAAEYNTMVDTRKRPKTPLMSATRCILQISGDSIHAQYPANLRRSAATASLSEYLTRKHAWPPGTYDRVEWRSFHMAARTYHSSEVHLLKLVHDMLPTRAHLAKFQSWTSPKCHHCEEPDTLDHLQRSKCNPVSTRYMTDICEAITQYFEKHHTPQAFQTTFLHCLLTWLNGENTIDITDTAWKGSPALHRDQQAIGWRLIPRGILSTEWITLLQQTLHNDHWRTRHNEVPEYTGPKWTIADTPSSASWSIIDSDSDSSLCLFEPEYIVEFDLPDAIRTNGSTILTIEPVIFLAGLIKIMWVELATLWRSHLDLIHQTATTKTSPVTREEATIQVRALQDFQALVEAPLRTNKYFPEDLDSFLEKSSLQQLKNYIQQYSPVLIASSARQSAMAPIQPQPLNPRDIRQDTQSDQSLSSNSSSLHPALEEAQHRKRTRRRNQSTVSHDTTSCRHPF